MKKTILKSSEEKASLASVADERGLNKEVSNALNSIPW